MKNGKLIKNLGKIGNSENNWKSGKNWKFGKNEIREKLGKRKKRDIWKLRKNWQTGKNEKKVKLGGKEIAPKIENLTKMLKILNHAILTFSLKAFYPNL